MKVVYVEHKTDISNIRKDFPILRSTIHGKPLVYLDNAATSQKPNEVIHAVADYYSSYNANVHRGVHSLGDQATTAYEDARKTVARFINASSPSEINFVRGTTEGINLVASSFGNEFISEGDEVLISEIEHHSNIVPWQMLCERKNAKLKVIPVDQEGRIDFLEFKKLLTERCRIVAVQHVSNAFGTIQEIKPIIEAAHEYGAKVLIDGAQAAPHIPIDVTELDCDFYCFSSHKMFGPTGIGVVYGKESLMDRIPPYQGGGEMISEVTFEKTTYNNLPYKFEAGTPNIAGAIGLKAAIDYIGSLNSSEILKHEQDLVQYATSRLSKIEGIKIYGNVSDKVAVVSFNIEGIHPYDIGVVLDKQGIAIRTGHHCCQPLMKKFGIEGTCRASFAFYNTIEEVDKLTEAIIKAMKLLK